MLGIVADSIRRNEPIDQDFLEENLGPSNFNTVVDPILIASGVVRKLPGETKPVVVNGQTKTGD